MRVSAIVLAAGKSSRMGRNKLLLPWDGSTVVRHVVETLASTSVIEIVVVVGHEAARIREALSGLDVRFVLNDNFEKGMGGSISAGVRAADSRAGALLIVLADMPWLTSEMASQVIALGSASTTIVVPQKSGRMGNPVLFGSAFRPDLEDLTGEKGARSVIEAHASNAVILEVEDEEVFKDLDVPEDLL